jgi:hypothetical protein
MADGWKNRIVKHAILPAKDFLAHPMNFRLHPAIQQEALKGSLDELGWIDDVMVNIQTQHVLNGHLRISLALREGDDTPVPVKYVDLSPEEELTALAVFDELTAMAGKDREKLDALLRDVKPSDAALQHMLSDLAAREGLYTGNGSPVDDPMAEWQGMPEFEHEDQTSAYRAIVHFATEQDLHDFEQLIGQHIPQNTHAIWFPKAERDNTSQERWSSDSA